ncbi:hypothetical protein LJ740_13445 [Planctobacterium marinum]|nr:hypothetical protein [Planctobacterium marinum]
MNQAEVRKIAYVFNFSNNWHPDWGGLLPFFQRISLPLKPGCLCLIAWYC